MAFRISNGTTVPHATNYSDLLDKLITFATVTNTDWVVVQDNRGTTGEIYLKGKDYSGTGAIYVGIKKFSDGANDIFGWFLQGYTGYNGTGFNSNPGAIDQRPPVIPLWNDTIPYWIFVNPRRIILVAKINTVYVAMYLGLMLPFASTGQWQYPLVVGGSNVINNALNSMPRYSDTGTTACVPFTLSATGAFGSTLSNLVVRDPAGTWVRIYNGTANYTPPGTTATVTALRGVTPYASGNWRTVRPNIDGHYPLRNLRVFSDQPNCFGILDGVKFVSGYNMSAEDTVTEDADTYTVFQDIYKTNLDSFFAVKQA
jgi:hypothetical protein